MKRILKSILKKIAIRFYYWGKEHDTAVREELRLKSLDEIATIDETAVIYKEATVENHLKDRTRIRIGKESRILGSLMIFGHGGEIEIGQYVFCGIDSRVWSSKKISIGNRVLISHNVNIHDN